MPGLDDRRRNDTRTHLLCTATPCMSLVDMMDPINLIYTNLILPCPNGALFLLPADDLDLVIVLPALYT